MTQRTDLAKEAEGGIPFECIPLGEKIIIFPLVPDDTDSKLIANVDQSSENLPELGVVVWVSYAAMQDVYEELADMEARIHGLKGRDKTVAQELFTMAKEHKLIERGDVLVLNRFSGMAIPGSLLLAYEPADLVTKLKRYPVRLKRTDERYDDAWANIGRAVEPAKDVGINLPERIVVAGR